MRLVTVAIVADEGVRILILLKVAQRVVPCQTSQPRYA